MNSPLIWIAIFLASGILAGLTIRTSLVLAILAAALSVLISLLTIKRKIISSLSLFLTAFFIGCLLFQIGQIYPANHIKNFTPHEPESVYAAPLSERIGVYIEGLIIDEPQLTRTSYGEPKVNFILEASGFQKGDRKQNLPYDNADLPDRSQAVTGKVKVFISGDAERLNYGDRILVNGLLSSPRGPSNPGEFDYAQYLKRDGIFSILSAKGYNVVLLEKGGGNAVLRIAYSVRNRLKEIIDSNLPKGSADFVSAILLGQRQEVDFELNDIFMKTGTIHLLAISGLHVGLLTFLVILILKIIRIPRKASVVATISFLIFYAILTSGRPSVIRATVMAIAILFGWLIGRESQMWNSLGLAAILILGFEPNALFDVGFQLSFISVASILYLTPKLEELFYYDRKLAVPFMSRWKRYFAEGAFVSAAAWLGVLPFVLYYFNIVTPIAIIANLFAVPLTFLIITSSMPFIIFTAFTPFIGKIFAGATWLLCAMLFGATDMISKFPLAYLYFPKPPAPFIVIYYIFIVALIEHKRFKISIGKIAALGLLFINIIIWQNALKVNDGRLKVTFLDVGHGDSIFIEFPNGGNMLIDGGKGGDWDVGRNIILPFLRNKGIDTLDAVVLTHPDADHVGGLTSVIEGLNIRRALENGSESNTDAYLNFKDVINRRKKTKRDVLRRGDSIEVRDTDLLCLNPPIEWISNSNVEDNDNSLVIKVSYGDVGLLFCADIEEKAINDILKFGQILDAEVLMLPHHGERLTLERQIFIEEVSPKYAVISQGRAVKEVLRSKEAEEFLLSKGIKVFRTNRDGAIFVETDGKSILINNFKSY